MGSVKKRVKRGVKKLGSSVKGVASSVGNTAWGLATGDVDKFERGLGQAYQSVRDTASGAWSVGAGALLDGTQQAVADLSGATAAQEQLDQQAEMSRREARRQALTSDAMARAEGREGARVVTGGRKKKNRGASATGVSGTSGSRGTGVQG